MWVRLIEPSAGLPEDPWVLDRAPTDDSAALSARLVDRFRLDLAGVLNALDRDALEHVLEAVRALPERQRAAVVLRHVLDHSHQQVALVLGCSEAAAFNADVDALPATNVSIVVMSLWLGELQSSV